MASEKVFENKIKDHLKYKRAWFIKYWGGGQFTKVGVPDILVCLKGHFIGIEVKAEAGRPTPIQLANLNDIERAGGYAILLYPDMLETFKVFVDALTCNDIERTNKYYNLMKGRRTEWNRKLELKL